MNGPGRTVAVSALLFVVIFFLRLVVQDPDEGVLFLMVMPIALLALEFGVVGGLVAAAVASVSIFGWTSLNDVSLGSFGVVVRVICFFAAGLGAGLIANDRERRTQHLFELHDKETRHQAALTVHQGILQNLTVAKLGLEMDDRDRAESAIHEALRSAQSFVSKGVDPEAPTFRPPSQPGSG